MRRDAIDLPDSLPVSFDALFPPCSNNVHNAGTCKYIGILRRAMHSLLFSRFFRAYNTTRRVHFSQIKCAATARRASAHSLGGIITFTFISRSRYIYRTVAAGIILFWFHDNPRRSKRLCPELILALSDSTPERWYRYESTSALISNNWMR